MRSHGFSIKLRVWPFQFAREVYTLYTDSLMATADVSTFGDPAGIAGLMDVFAVLALSLVLD